MFEQVYGFCMYELNVWTNVWNKWKDGTLITGLHSLPSKHLIG